MLSRGPKMVVYRTHDQTIRCNRSRLLISLQPPPSPPPRGGKFLFDESIKTQTHQISGREGSVRAKRRHLRRQTSVTLFALDQVEKDKERTDFARLPNVM